MTYTPDRRKRKAGQRARRATLAPRVRAARKQGMTSLPSPKHGTNDPVGDEEQLPNTGANDTTNQAMDTSDTLDTGHSGTTLAQQLKDAGLDLTGHELGPIFEALAPVETTEATDTTTSEPIEDSDTPALPWTTDEPLDTAGTIDETPAWNNDEDTAPAAPGLLTGEPAEDTTPASLHPATDDLATTVDAIGRPVSPHPLITNNTWNDLKTFAPEVTTSITTLMRLNTTLRSFTRPMGPDEALKIIDGAEALTRISQALSTTALSVYERVGTPTDSGAKDTKSLIRDRLNLTSREADRRATLAKNLGGRVTTNGQALPPQHPVVADKLHDGTLSTDQVSAIEACLTDIPIWADENMRTQIEADLVAYAPKVAVKDLRDIFRRILAHLDPDGTEPLDEDKRENYYVTARPKRNGDWKLDGILDPETGAELHGLLTSRIESAQPTTTNPFGATGEDSTATGEDSTGTGEATDEAAFAPTGGLPRIPGQERFDTLDAVFTGDRHDAPPWAVFDATTPNPATDNSADDNHSTGSDDTTSTGGTAGDATDTPVDTSTHPGYGVHTDGTEVNVTGAQPTARTWIYERFATLIGRISMKEAEKGSPYALVITAKASDIATGTGEARTGAGDRIPMKEITSRGLDGRVFFNLIDDTGRTVAVRTENRFANKHQTAIITARDRGCIFPGCDSPPGWCDVNHVVPHSKGGKTDINNLCLLCSAHHHLLDRSDWEITMLNCGRPAAVPPTSIDPAKRPILHSRFITDDIIETLCDD